MEAVSQSGREWNLERRRKRYSTMLFCDLFVLWFDFIPWTRLLSGFRDAERFSAAAHAYLRRVVFFFAAFLRPRINWFMEVGSKPIWILMHATMHVLRGALGSGQTIMIN